MRTIVTGKNIDVPEAVRQYAERKMRRLERFLDDRTDAVLELSVEHHKSTDDSRIADGTADDTGEARRIVKTKRFAIEPMFEEDAITAMENLGHSFYVFVNAEDERLNVLYRRNDGNFGVIEPMVGGPASGRGASGAGNGGSGGRA